MKPLSPKLSLKPASAGDTAAARYRRSRTEIAEIAADKADTEEDDQHDPFHQAENSIQFFIECDPLDMQGLPCFVRNVLNKAQRTDKTAQHTSEQDRADDEGAEERQYLLPALLKQYVQMAEIKTPGIGELIEVIRAGKDGEVNVREHRSEQATAEDQQCKAEDHHDPADGLKAEHKALFALISRHDPGFADGQLFFFVKQLAQQHVKGDTYG